MTTAPAPHRATVPPTATRRLLATAAVGLATALATVLPAPSASAYQAGVYQIVNAATDKCLEVADWRTDNGAPVRQWTCTGGDNQKWTNGPGLTIVNVHSGRCLEIPGFSTTWGTQADQWTCNGGSNQDWLFDGDGHHAYTHSYRNANSGLQLDLYGANPADGTAVVQWGWNSGGNQHWRYDPYINPVPW
ncbi:RICIN domain-containing protein [Kitasatospora sp. NPDC056446]|uniref:RICIN domain-containing protein n=1 Tax=Kitasatospora sp. NPDC056446 TaxID=3345819 RepID=UPI0036BA14D0